MGNDHVLVAHFADSASNPRGEDANDQLYSVERPSQVSMTCIAWTEMRKLLCLICRLGWLQGVKKTLSKTINILWHYFSGSLSASVSALIRQGRCELVQTADPAAQVFAQTHVCAL
ncbi:unnamed protein product [Protopolystoma xenopodis]|uniref:Uncharacterized protein n=1 Tax=Protopolystoma xenopodis TaxID=117903 RepID=A0A448WGU8_9PLAT|nr:unnamed protein product [Protopolystoma xenopodis]